MSKDFGHAFRDAGLLQQALRHRSAGTGHNERLEFLGDALLNLIIAEALHAQWPKADEGTLTRARSSLVRESTLALIARELGLGERIELGPGEMKNGGNRRDSILADALEAVVAAIHIDAGFEVCRHCVLPWFASMLRDLPIGKVEKDPKTRLQEWLQGRQLARPEYSLVTSHGDEHARVFRMRCKINDPLISCEAEGNSLRAAEQAAAELVLTQIETKP